MNRGLPVLDLPGGRDSWCYEARPLGARMTINQYPWRHNAGLVSLWNMFWRHFITEEPWILGWIRIPSDVSGQVNSIWIRYVWMGKFMNSGRKSCGFKNILIGMDGTLVGCGGKGWTGFWANLVLSTGLIIWIGHRKEIRKMTFRSSTTVSLETYSLYISTETFSFLGPLSRNNGPEANFKI